MNAECEIEQTDRISAIQDVQKRSKTECDGR